MPSPGAVYLLAGGALSRRSGKDPLLALAIAGAGAKSPRVAYVGAPSDDSRMFYQMLSRMLRAAGAGRVEHVRLAGRHPDLGAAKACLESADLVFITGGDVERGMQIIRETGFGPVLDERRSAGVPFLGVSAGSIALARRWIRWTDPEDDATASLFDCLGYAPIHCDTHGEEECWPELQALLARCPPLTVGYGIPTGCALRLDADREPVALGGSVHRFRRDGDLVSRLDDLVPR